MIAVISLLCATLAFWVATKRYGPHDVATYRMRQLGVAPADMNSAVSSTIYMYTPRMPFVVSDIEGSSFSSDYINENRRYFFWCFGFVVKLPFERRIVNGSVTEADLARFTGQANKGMSK
jgi:hypothetical protein